MNQDLADQIASAVVALRAARAKGVDWILARLGADGRPVGAERFNSYYRLPWSLALAGQRDSATAVLAWIAHNALDARGDLRPGAPRAPFLGAIASYPLPQIAIGAWHLERYDLARSIMAFVRSAMVDPHTGGAYSERPELRHTGRTDLLCTAQVGLAAMTVGDDTLADACYRWTHDLIAMQPDLPRRLYPCCIGAQLLTAADARHSAWDLVTDFHMPFQQFYNPGIAAAFLGRYAAFKGDDTANALARSMLDLNAQGADLQFDHAVNAQICKFGWGAAVLLDTDARPGHAVHALRMAHWFVDSQHADGHWAPSGFLVPQPDDADRLPKTAEHVLHVVTLIGALAAYCASPTSPASD
jgi:hypothetical protein